MQIILQTIYHFDFYEVRYVDIGLLSTLEVIEHHFGNRLDIKITHELLDLCFVHPQAIINKY